jgi:hypothetical protein
MAGVIERNGKFVVQYRQHGRQSIDDQDLTDHGQTRMVMQYEVTACGE